MIKRTKAAIMKHILFLLFASTTFWSNAQTFTNSNLPIVVINTGNPTFNDLTIPDDPKINASIGIIDNGPGMLNYLTDPFNNYNGTCGIETRGNSTQDFEKKSYSVELWGALGQDTSASLLGMGGEEDWILHSMVIDKSQLRIPFTFNLARRAGHYASDWRYVELVIDNDYRGVYILCEKIKRDDDRVDIAKLEPTEITGDDVTGGYILRIDWLDEMPQGILSNHNAMSGSNLMMFQYHYPKATNIVPQQSSYIKSYIDDFEEGLFATNYTNNQGRRYNEYIDMTSFTDFLIINEFSKNSDGYKLSSYIHKDKDSKGGKLKAGPIWDFDQTYGLSEVCSCSDYTGWTYLQNQPACEDLESMPMWWQALMSDDLFTNHLRCRWETLRNGPLHLDSINNWIDNHVALLTDPIARNFTKWDDFIGEQIWYEPQPIPQSYPAEIQYMKDWINNRIAWLDTNMPGDCTQDIVGITETKAFTVEVFPNPASEKVYAKIPAGSDLKLVSNDGKTVEYRTNTSTLEELSIINLEPGIYFLSVQTNDRLVTKKLVIQ